uniref:Uncharacterized protein n=1 Tax=Oryzias melastigma TaxID=30732 RepID=A0A3B3CS93_ORYME
MEDGLHEQAACLRADLARSLQENRELQERLMVSEATVQAQAEQLKDYRDLLSESLRCACVRAHWKGLHGALRQGKYNTLIQAQARELSHLRQRMREGQGVCHILTQHLGDTTKAFEELLRSNDIDYYMGQSFREQLAQNSALAQRVITKITGRKKTFSHHKKVISCLSGILLKLFSSLLLHFKGECVETIENKTSQDLLSLR